MLYLIFDVEAGFEIEKDLHSLDISIVSSIVVWLASSVRQKGATILWALEVNQQQESVNQPDRAY